MRAQNILPITEAREKLGNLVNQASGENYIVLTKAGKPKVALVDIAYLERLEAELTKLSQKTFIDPRLLPFTREFTDEEIKTWEQEDKL